MASQEFQNLVSVLFQQEQLSSELKLWGQSCFIRKPLLLGCQGGWDNGRATNKGARVVPLPARSPLWDHSQAIVTAKLLQCQEKEQSFKLWYNIWRIPYNISKCFWNNLLFAYFYTPSPSFPSQTLLQVADGEGNWLQAPPGVWSGKGIT